MFHSASLAAYDSVINTALDDLMHNLDALAAQGPLVDMHRQLGNMTMQVGGPASEPCFWPVMGLTWYCCSKLLHPRCEAWHKPYNVQQSVLDAGCTASTLRPWPAQPSWRILLTGCCWPAPQVIGQSAFG